MRSALEGEAGTQRHAKARGVGGLGRRKRGCFEDALGGRGRDGAVGGGGGGRGRW